MIESFFLLLPMDDRHVWLNLPRDDSEFFLCVFLRTIVTFSYKQKFPKKKPLTRRYRQDNRPADYIWATVTSGHCQSSLHVGREREREGRLARQRQRTDWQIYLWDAVARVKASPNSAPSTGCPSSLRCGWISTELISGFTLVTHTVNW